MIPNKPTALDIGVVYRRSVNDFSCAHVVNEE